MKAALSSIFLIAGVALAQERCDAPSPSIFCNTTEILAYESSECTSFHIFLTRGSDEPYPGRLGNITKEICAGIGKEDCGFENVEFPAKSTAWGVDEWCKSAGTGAANGQKQMKAYSDKCPDSKLMLLGFSQGGAVAQDILGGGGGDVFACTQDSNPALDEEVGNKVVAAATFGAVIRSRDTNFTVGDGKPFDGRRARTPEQLSALEKYSDVFLDYCHYGDPMCAVGSTPESVEHHLNYFIQHNEEVTKWFVDMAKANKGTVSNGNTPTRPQSGTSSSVAAKPAATSSATPTAITSATPTDSNEASSAQTSSSTGNASTGAAGSLTVSSGCVAVLAGVVVALFQ
ncbi:carbohydrate esterase family 5 protein [Plenodomus tracheiphilus IPT5]|uniref:Carbohydrate esterase family 5 protein n=1 Tax=Plenodomus tracheiphilus IPT5 TaxID=1408161 RepID=A0A6A7AW18_9PLEO|nr:carbohydrate esterase family 5 protein [Plenodomus tracheiphilus IPT5]